MGGVCLGLSGFRHVVRDSEVVLMGGNWVGVHLVSRRVVTYDESWWRGSGSEEVKVRWLLLRLLLLLLSCLVMVDNGFLFQI